MIDLKLYVRPIVIICTVIAIAIGVALVVFGFDKKEQLVYYMLMEAGNVVIITAVIYTIAKWVFAHKDDLYVKKTERIQETVKEQLNLQKEELMKIQEISGKAVWLDALNASTIKGFYKSRATARENIHNSIAQRKVDSINLMGISLNDFMREDNQCFHETWKKIQGYIDNDTPPEGSDKLDVKVLIIDPNSNGAFMRSSAETATNTGSRLDADVRSTLTSLYELEQKAQGSNFRKVTFSIRVYRTSPTMFLFWTTYSAFVQAYYFRPYHTQGLCPIMEFNKSGERECVHAELGFHFDWIWNRDSITAKQFIDMHCIGVDEAIRTLNITNMYHNCDEEHGKIGIVKSRIIKLIEQTKKCLWIKGVSLNSYFTSTSDLMNIIIKAHRDGVDVRILLINPNGQQAKLWSFREYLTNNPDSNWEDFNKKDKSSWRLFVDTGNSINFIKREFGELASGKDLGLRLYNSSPECFTLLTDDAVLVEQYHFGKISTEGVGLNTCGKAPIIEYRNLMLGEAINRGETTYQVFKDDFEYVYENCSIGLNEYEKMK